MVWFHSQFVACLGCHTTVNRARNIKRLFDIGGISWFGLADFFIDEMGNKCKRSGANPQQCKRSMMGMKWGNVELILRYSYIKQTFCFYSFSFGQMHFLLDLTVPRACDAFDCLIWSVCEYFLVDLTAPRAFGENDFNFAIFFFQMFLLYSIWNLITNNI